MGNYLLWHYGEALLKILIIWRNLILFPIYYFSVPLHAATLFSPWKRQQSRRMGPGFHPEELIEEMSFNLISRILGAMMRTGVIVTGCCFCIALVPVGAVALGLWLLIPGTGFFWWGRLQDRIEHSVPYILDNTMNDLPQLAQRLAVHPQGIWVWQRFAINPRTVLAAAQPTNNMDHTSSWMIFSNELNNRLTHSSPLQKGKQGGIGSEAKRGNASEAPPTDGSKTYSPYTKVASEHFSHDTAHQEITISDLLVACSAAYQPLKHLLAQHGVGIPDVIRLCAWYDQIKEQKEQPAVLDLEKIKRLPGIGADWAYGYTALMDRYARDMTKIHTPYPLLIGRERELERIEDILVKTENNNALIVGEPGVDRHVLLRTLAYRLATGQAPAAISHTRILSIDMHAIIASQQSTGQIKGYLTQLLEEARAAGNVIIAIDELDRYVTTKDERMDFSDVWEKVAVSHQAFIAVTTPEHYHRYIQQNPALTQLFEMVHIDPPPVDIVRTQLQMAIVPILERKYHVWITYQAIEKVLEDAGRFITTMPFPGSAVNLLDEVCVQVATTGYGRVILPRHVDALISEKFHTAVGITSADETDKLRRIEELLHARVVGQEAAIATIAGTLRRARLNISSPNRPMGSFLFLGPTGVGKTETAKTIAEVYFGSEERILRFDMGEFQKEEGIRRLIGSADGAPGELTARLRENPFCVLLFDEFEKADREIFNLFLPLIDEGYITDAAGVKADARNTFIIATSNAGAEYIRKEVKSQKSKVKSTVDSDSNGAMEQSSNGETQQPINSELLTHGLLDYIQSNNIFSPELINRFDAAVVFTPLAPEHVRAIVTYMLESLNKRLSNQQISIAITPELIDGVAHKGYDPEYGARAIRRVIEETVEDQIAKQFLAGRTQPGTVLHIAPP